ncbi:MAG: hypothetical protein ACD_4C00375G0001, partial [uncultured bacterium (gcode 4)]
MSFFLKQKRFLVYLILFSGLIAWFWISNALFVEEANNTDEIIYCKQWDDCSMQKWVDIVKDWVNDIEQEKKFSEYIQDIAAYLMFFVAIVWVLYIIYAWFNILIAWWKDENVKKSKTTIIHVLIWIVVMFLAYSIVLFIIKVVNTWKIGFTMPNLIEKTYAYTSNDKNTFDEYKKSVELITSQLERDYKVNWSISSEELDKLEEYVKWAILTFPDNNDFISNNNIAKNLLIAIDVVRENPDSETRITELAKSIKSFLNNIKIPRIKAQIIATPISWNAPLTVSLRSTNVIDPSWVTIPSSNYTWWIKNPNWSKSVIWTWPSIFYTFKEERTYIVNLDIVSASRNSNWKTSTLPFSSSVNVNVLPKIWTVYFYINWINVSDLDRFKITPQIWKAWLIIDATASQAAGWSTFSRTSWDFWNWIKSAYNLYPRIEKQYYIREWIYRLRLSLLTNENKEIIKTLDLEVRDPIASIRLKKSTWFVWEEFKMSSNTYFMPGNLAYEWKIIDLWGNQEVYSSTHENIAYSFKKTGKFSIRLKSTSPSWKEDIDTKVITIESRDPVWSFQLKQNSSETPNTFFFDATQSFDPDTFNNSKLRFNWYADWMKIDLENPTRWWSVWTYTFNTLGNHKISLEVSNEDWKTVTVKKEVNVESLLSVKMNFTPKIVQLWKTVSIIADSKEANVFEWKFWDWSSEITSNWRISHVYKKAWNYTITLNVKWSNWKSNKISRTIYVIPWDEPFSLISLKRDKFEFIQSPSECDWNDAFIIDRSKPITISWEDSVNVDWRNTWLDYSWKYMNKSSSQKSFNYKFDELGCFPIYLTVKSEKTWKINKNVAYVKVVNLPPKVSWLTVTTIDQNADPVIVKVIANNPVDEDWVIVSYLWYYYSDTDPEPQDYRITKTPTSTFVLPKVHWTYYFVLIAEDSNWAKINTSENSEEQYPITLDSDNINTPLISLSVNKTTIATWDEIHFKASTKNIFWTDITNKVEYKWDFDWDWFYEETTSNPKISHKYTIPWNFSFKVKATYKGISNTKFQMITVKNVLKPNFEYFAVWNKLILLNTSEWLYTSANWDLWNSIKSTNNDYFIYDSTEGQFPKNVTLKISDWTESKEITGTVKKDVVNKLKVGKNQNNLIYFTFPVSKNNIIDVKSPDDKIYIYLWESKWNISKYCIDSDVSLDSDLNWSNDDDCDNKWTGSFENWEPFVLKNLNVTTSSKTIKLAIYDWDKLVEQKDLKLNFTYFKWISGSTEIKEDNNIGDADKAILEEIKNLIKKSPEANRLKMTQYFSLIQENWFDDREKIKSIIDFETYINSEAWLDQKLKDDFYNLLESLILKQDQTKDEVTLAAKVLKSLIPKTNKNYDQIMKNIDDILSHPTNTKLNKELWEFILNSIKDDNNIENKDKLIIKSQLQVIIYGWQWNIPKDEALEDQNESSWIISFIIWFVKLFWYLLLWILGILIGFFIYFKVVNKNENLSFQDFLIEKFLRENNGVENIKKEDILNNVKTEESFKKEE